MPCTGSRRRSLAHSLIGPLAHSLTIAHSLTQLSANRSVSQPVSQQVSRLVGVSQSCNRPVTGHYTVCHSVTDSHCLCRYVTHTVCRSPSSAHTISHFDTLYCRSVTLYCRSLCHFVTHTVYRSVALPSHICRSVTHTAWRSVTHILSIGLSLIHCLPLCHSHPVSRKSCCVLSIALTRVLRVALTVTQTHCSLSRQPAHRLTLLSLNYSHAALIPYATPSCYSFTLYSPHTQLSPAQSNLTGYLTQLHCTHAKLNSACPLVPPTRAHRASATLRYAMVDKSTFS